MDGYSSYIIQDPTWGEIKILRPLPRDDEPWGKLAPLRDTPWAKLIPVVSGEALSYALHGHATPLMRQIGPEPKALLRMVPEGSRRCGSFKDCLMAGPDCAPGPKLPDCYVAPNLGPEASTAASIVALAWKEGRYVLLVEGAEFSLR